MSSPQRGPFDVWAPLAHRLRLSVGDDIVEMVRGERRLVDAGGRSRDISREEIDYGYLIDDSDTPRPDPRSRRQPAGVHQRSRTYDPTRFRWTDSPGPGGSSPAR